MEFAQMLPTLQSQASRIFNGDRDSMQDALAMSFVNYNSCLDRNGRQLPIGELTNFIKHRATELNNCKRPQFGNISTKRTNDVYFKQNYLRGDVEILSFDYEDFENSEDDRLSNPDSFLGLQLDILAEQGIKKPVFRRAKTGAIRPSSQLFTIFKN